MKNIPLFTTPYGVATLILSEIPCSQTAYINLRTVTDMEGLVGECIQFCRMCGAEDIYGTGEGDWSAYSPAYEEWEYQIEKGKLTSFCEHLELQPVTVENVAIYEEIYNTTFQSHLGTLQHPYQTIPENAYLAYDGQSLVGLGQVTEDTLKTIIATEKGFGYRLAMSLLEKTNAHILQLQVMSYNTHAIRFYEQLGFIKTEVLHKNFKIL